MKTLADYATACGDLLVSQTGEPSIKIAAVTENSQQVEPATLFVAIRGEKRDGATFIPAAVDAGAAGIVCRADAVLPPNLTVPVLRVSHDYRAFGLLAECYHDFPARTMQIWGVTGTKGKSTTAYLLRNILRQSGAKVGMIGTVVYDFGDGVEMPADRTTPTPLELQLYLARMRKAGVKHLVIEVSSHALDQGRLGSMAFHAALFTNLSGDHLDYHKTMDAYYAAKARLFLKHLAKDGVCVINLDDAWGRRLQRDIVGARLANRLIGYGVPMPDAASSPDNSTFALRLTPGELRPRLRRMDMQGMELEVTWQEKPLAIRSSLTGRYNAQNVIGAVGAALALGIAPATVVDAMRDFTGVPGRLDRVRPPSPTDLHIFVDYAHTDDALVNVLGALRPMCNTAGKRLIVVFGAGGDRDRTKRPRMARAAAEGADHVIVTSDNPRTEDPARIVAEIVAGLPKGASSETIVDRRAAIFAAILGAAPGDTVILAGKGHEPYQEIKGVKHPFSDTAVALEALAERAAGIAKAKS